MKITDDKIIKEGKEPDALYFILSNCFKSGFGTLGKSEIDLILFTCLLKFSDQENLSDHALSKYLQITQQRIRKYLKEKASVKFLLLSRTEAINVFIERSRKAKIDDKYIDIPVNDVAVKNEIEAILDEENILLHYQLNPKIFRIRIDDFMELLIQFELLLGNRDSKQQIESTIIEQIKQLAAKDENLTKQLSNGKSNIAQLTKSTLKEALVKGGLAFGIDLLASIIPGGAFLSGPVKELIKTVKEKI